jgi:hypothetical protein
MGAARGVGTLGVQPLMHRSAWKDHSPKSISSILHIPHPLWVEDGLLPGPTLITRRNIWKQWIEIR